MKPMQMHMYVWRLPSSFVAVAQAKSVAEARRLVLNEIGDERNTDSVRTRARQLVMENVPTIWNYANAEFTITDSAELRLADAAHEEQRKEIARMKTEGFFVGDQIEFSVALLRSIIWEKETWGGTENVTVVGIDRQASGAKRLKLDVARTYVPSLHCECPGCSEEHTENDKCDDLREIIMGVVGGALLAVCKECAVELARKMFA